MSTLDFERFLAKVDLTALASALERPWWRFATEGRTPLAMTLTGDVFLRDADGAIHFLDTSFGVVERIATSDEDLRRRFEDAAFARALLRIDNVLELESAGIVADPNQCFAFVPAPVLGLIRGARAIAFDAYLDFMGQLVSGIRELPAGAAFRLEGTELRKMPRDRGSFAL